MADKEHHEPDMNHSTESHPPQNDATSSGPSSPPRHSLRKSRRGDSNDGSVPGSDRRRFLVKLSLFGAASAAAYVKPEVAAAAGSQCLSPCALAISGTGTVTSVLCGTSSYAFSGSAAYTIANEVVEIQQLQVTGDFVSGLDIGPILFENVGTLIGPANTDGTYSVSGTLAYTDNFNAALNLAYAMNGTHAGGVIDTLSGSGDGQGLCTAGGAADSVQTEILSLD